MKQLNQRGLWLPASMPFQGQRSSIRLIGLSALAVLIACRTEPSACRDAAELDASGAARICPCCQAADMGGTETSDISGDDNLCTGDAIPLPAEAAVLAERLRALYSGPIEASLRWSLDDSPLPGIFPTRAQPDGYDPVSRISGHV